MKLKRLPLSLLLLRRLLSAAPVAALIAAAGLVSTIDEAPLKAVDTLRIIAAQNLKKVDEVPLSKSIKDLVGGKSTFTEPNSRSSSPRKVKS